MQLWLLSILPLFNFNLFCHLFLSPIRIILTKVFRSQTVVMIWMFNLVMQILLSWPRFLWGVILGSDPWVSPARASLMQFLIRPIWLMLFSRWMARRLTPKPPTALAVPRGREHLHRLMHLWRILNSQAVLASCSWRARISPASTPMWWTVPVIHSPRNWILLSTWQWPLPLGPQTMWLITINMLSPVMPRCRLVWRPTLLDRPQFHHLVLISPRCCSVLMNRIRPTVCMALRISILMISRWIWGLTSLEWCLRLWIVWTACWSRSIPLWMLCMPIRTSSQLLGFRMCFPMMVWWPHWIWPPGLLKQRVIRILWMISMRLKSLLVISRIFWIWFRIWSRWSSREIFMWITAVIRWMHLILVGMRHPTVILAMTLLWNLAPRRQSKRRVAEPPPAVRVRPLFLPASCRIFMILGLAFPWLSSRSTWLSCCWGKPLICSHWRCHRWHCRLRLIRIFRSGVLWRVWLKGVWVRILILSLVLTVLAWRPGRRRVSRRLTLARCLMVFMWSIPMGRSSSLTPRWELGLIWMQSLLMPRLLAGWKLERAWIWLIKVKSRVRVMGRSMPMSFWLASPIPRVCSMLLVI